MPEPHAKPQLEPRALLARHFVPATLLGWLRRGHPYDFIDTYRTMRALYRYKAWYVNLGLWTDGADTEEAGRALMHRVATPLELQAGERLIDAGSGLGQSAVDLVQEVGLGSVLGVNPNPKQVGFANDLAAGAGLGTEIKHDQADACTALSQEPQNSAHGVLALECIGHFRDPMGFFQGVHHVLAPGRRIAFCLNVADRGFSLVDRWAFRLGFGFVPQSAEVWYQRLEQAGFQNVTLVDLTSQVTRPLTDIVQLRLEQPTPEIEALSETTKWVIRVLQGVTRRAVEGGRLRYVLFHASVPT